MLLFDNQTIYLLHGCCTVVVTFLWKFPWKSWKLPRKLQLPWNLKVILSFQVFHQLEWCRQPDYILAAPYGVQSGFRKW